MAFDEQLAGRVRKAMGHGAGVSEKKMFGGIAFMLYGNMLCGVHKNGGMFRVGKANEAAALAIDGVGEMTFTSRPMGGLVDVSDDAMEDDDSRHRVMALALEFVTALPAR